MDTNLHSSDTGRINSPIPPVTTSPKKASGRRAAAWTVWEPKPCEYFQDDLDYLAAKRQLEMIEKLLDEGKQRTGGAKRKPCQDSLVVRYDLDHYERLTEGCRERMWAISEKCRKETGKHLLIPLLMLCGRLQLARMRAGMSQTDLARSTNTSEEEVQRWESCGYERMPLPQLLAVLKTLGLDEADSLISCKAVLETTEWAAHHDIW